MGEWLVVMIVVEAKLDIASGVGVRQLRRAVVETGQETAVSGS